MKKFLLYISLPLFIIGCSLFPNYDLAGMFYGSSPRSDARFETSMQWNDAHTPLSMTVPEVYKVYVAADTHVDSTSRNMENFMKSYRADEKAPFAVHLGDLINAQANYARFDSAIHVVPDGYVKKPTDTLLIAAGNHDIYFGQWKEFLAYYHTASYWFETRSENTSKPLDLFIVLDSASGNLGGKQIKWLRDLLQQKSKEGYRHIIILTHTNFFKQDSSQGICSNYPIEETAELTGLFSQYGVSMVWNGHDHNREITSYGGVTYITTDSMKDPDDPAYYMVVTMGSEINYQFILL